MRDSSTESSSSRSATNNHTTIDSDHSSNKTASNIDCKRPSARPRAVVIAFVCPSFQKSLKVERLLTYYSDQNVATINVNLSSDILLVKKEEQLKQILHSIIFEALLVATQNIRRSELAEAWGKVPLLIHVFGYSATLAIDTLLANLLLLDETSSKQSCTEKRFILRVDYDENQQKPKKTYWRMDEDMRMRRVVWITIADRLKRGAILYDSSPSKLSFRNGLRVLLSSRTINPCVRLYHIARYSLSQSCCCFKKERQFKMKHNFYRYCRTLRTRHVFIMDPRMVKRRISHSKWNDDDVDVELIMSITQNNTTAPSSSCLLWPIDSYTEESSVLSKYENYIYELLSEVASTKHHHVDPCDGEGWTESEDDES